MTETEIKAALISDIEAFADKYPLQPSEIDRIVAAWFYDDDDEFSAALFTRPRYCRAVAEGWRKRASKAAPDTLKYMDMGNPVESNAPFNNMKRMEQNWLDEATRLEAAAATSTNTTGVQGTVQYKNIPAW